MFSTFAATIAALVPMLRTSAQLDGVTIRDGGEVTAESAKEVVTIAYESEDVPGVVAGTFDFEGPGIKRGPESYSINCAIHLLTGSTGNVSASRLRAAELLGYIAAVLNADPTLGRNVMTARIGSWGLTQPQTPRGLMTVLAFSIDCRGYTVAVA